MKMSFPEEATELQRARAEALAWKLIYDPETLDLDPQVEWAYRHSATPHIRFMEAFKHTIDHPYLHGDMPLVQLGELETLATVPTFIQFFGKEDEHVGAEWEDDSGRISHIEEPGFWEFVRRVAKREAVQEGSHKEPKNLHFLGFISREEAQKRIHEPLTYAICMSFVAASDASSSGSMQTMTEVVARNTGWSVEWTFAYLLHYVHFGSPTPTVKGVLSPGYCCFAGRHTGSPTLVPDPTMFDIPKHTRCVVTCF